MGIIVIGLVAFLSILLPLMKIQFHISPFHSSCISQKTVTIIESSQQIWDLSE